MGNHLVVDNVFSKYQTELEQTLIQVQQLAPKEPLPPELESKLNRVCDELKQQSYTELDQQQANTIVKVNELIQIISTELQQLKSSLESSLSTSNNKKKVAKAYKAHY